MNLSKHSAEIKPLSDCAPICGEYRGLFLDFHVSPMDVLYREWEASDTVETICEGPTE